MNAAQRSAIVIVVSVASAALLTTAIWAATRNAAPPPATMMGNGYGAGMMGAGVGPAMMGGYGLPGDGQRVDSLTAARQRAQAFADPVGLRAGEVMQFSNGFYAELDTVDGRGATEVLIDARDGRVQLEYGPAMMWNTRYGMHTGAVSGPTPVSTDDARAIAQRWLDDRHTGLAAGNPEEFPGYVTLHTLRDAKIIGMMSVNTTTGQVWYHSWHGQYLTMSEN
jgi:hypothetical protein